MIKNAVERFNEQTNGKASVALIGGHAAIYFGAERTTLDVDISFYSPVEKPGQTFYGFLKNHLPPRFTLRFIEATKDPSDPLKHDLIVINDSEGEYPRIDILMIRYKWELQGQEQALSAAGLSFPIMPMQYLAAMKLMAGGRKDELDIIDLLKGMSEEEVNKTHQLAKKVGKDGKFQSLLKESRR
jgi:hypothetical protein